MPRPGWVKPEFVDRLPDRVSVGVLTQVFPPELVDSVLLELDRVEQRRRSLPARLVVYYVLAMALWPESSYEEVMRQLTEGLSWASGGEDSWQIPDKAAIARARARLGFEPMQLLFDLACRPMATELTVGACYRGLLLMSIDGTCLDVADTPENSAAFGRPGSHRRVGGGAFPQVRLVGLCESGTHALVAAALGSYRTSERELASRVLPNLEPGMLCLADRGIYSFDRFAAAAGTGAELLWRVSQKVRVERETVLGDGSYLSTLKPARRAGHNRHAGLRVRVIEYQLESPEGIVEDEPVTYRLISTLLEPEVAPAAELAALYRERWEIENVFDELKTHQRGPGVVLRSRSPDGVLQEVYGFLLTHYAIRRVMHEAALTTRVDSDRLSFVRSLRAARRSTRAGTGFSPLEPG